MRLLVLGLFAGAGVWWFYGYAGGHLPPQCSVGIAGTEASVTVAGWTAPTACDQMVDETENAYRWDGPPPTNPLICRFPIQNLTYTVRDRGTLMIYGSAICENLRASYQSRTAGAAAAPSKPPYSSCGMQVVGHDMVVFISGEGAEPACASMPSLIDVEMRDFGGDVGAIRGTAVCSFERAGLVYSVYDTGGQYFGGRLCAALGD